MSEGSDPSSRLYRWLWPAVAALLVSVAGWGLCASESVDPMSALVDDVMAVLNLEHSQKRVLIDGGTLHTGLPDLEVAENQVAAAGAMLLINRPLAEVVEACLDGETFRRHSEIVEYHFISGGEEIQPPSASAFEGVRLTAAEAAEVNKLLRADRGDRHNLSEREIARFRSIDHKEPNAAAQVSQAYAGALFERHSSYLDSGLSGTAPYARRKGRQQSPGKQLALAAQSAQILRKHFPAFHGAVLGFPEIEHEGVRHSFHWFKQIIDERPAFALSHSMVEIREDHALGCAVQYYVGHGYDSMLTLVGVARWQDRTLLFCVLRAFSEKASGFASGLRHKKGRQAVGKSLAQHFEHVREALDAKPQN